MDHVEISGIEEGIFGTMFVMWKMDGLFSQSSPGAESKESQECTVEYASVDPIQARIATPWAILQIFLPEPSAILVLLRMLGTTSEVGGSLNLVTSAVQDLVATASWSPC